MPPITSKWRGNAVYLDVGPLSISSRPNMAIRFLPIFGRGKDGLFIIYNLRRFVNLVEFKKGTIPAADGHWVELPSQPHQNLDWTKQLVLDKDEKVVWYFNLGLEDPHFPLDDELRFSALALALQQFTKEVWPQFQEQTLGLCLYRGIIASDRWAEFAMYFQMLAHKLPDEAPIWLLFDLDPTFSASKAMQLISVDGFEHFHIALRGKLLPRDGYEWDDKQLVYRSQKATTGLVFPSTLVAPEQFDRLAKEPVRIVHESFLAEQWDGLDRLVVIADSLTPQGQRMLQGFAAAGGEVVIR